MSILQSNESHITINADGASKEVRFQNNGTQNMVLDSSGRVGIGTSSPQSELHIADPAANAVVRLESSTTGQGNIFFDDTSDNIGKVGYDHSNNSLQFTTNSSERMRIDSSGRLCIGSSTFGSGAGAYISGSGGYFWGRSDGDRAAYFDRLTSDGYIVEFRKDGTAVGQIASDSGSMSIGSGDVAVYFDAPSDRIIPINMSTRSARNDAIDIGGNPHRFKDLYLSGGVYVGGTGSANYLDDYEEGTWTPTLLFAGSESGHTYDSQTGVYTKIGNKVFCDFHLSITAKSGTSGSVAVGGLPFGVENSHAYTSLDGGTINFGYYIGTTGIYGLTGRAVGASSYANLYRKTSASGDMGGNLQNADVTNSFSVRGTFFYQTTA